MATASEIRTAAKAIFSAQYHWPAEPYRLLNPLLRRRAFAWALNEARRRAALAAMPADEKAVRIAALRERLELTTYMANWSQAKAGRAEIEAQIRDLAA